MVKKSRGGQTINSSQRRRQNYLRRKKIGAVLIEFAFAIPVFLVLMYYIHDLPKYKLMQRKMQFMANITAAAIQNVAKQRVAAGEKVLVKDLDNIRKLASLSIFPGLTQYSQVKNRRARGPYGYCPLLNIHIIKGTGDNTGYTSRHIVCIPVSTTGYDVFDETGPSVTPDAFSALVFRTSSTSSNDICPNLTIKNGETKVIVEPSLCTITVGEDYRKKFGFLFLTPSLATATKSADYNYFHAITIFTPMPGAFDDTAPQ